MLLAKHDVLQKVLEIVLSVEKQQKKWVLDSEVAFEKYMKSYC
jgi:hypothetical protein